ncbi:hypothetical protein LLEC1_03097 [Akanthomyces lecanii]|uniref:Uncharacterized protein n=1 Tax=Cordyceps confragosa TaxID=2714763 RepID=A0A179IID1_CORDF|nr:hypothetical protein LLEC1_03097 [Akanthomyces lecanii]
MAKLSELDLLNARVQEHIQQNIFPHLDDEERRLYKDHYQNKIEFSLDTLNPNNHSLINGTEGTNAFALESILAQALFGRAKVMEYERFREAYQMYGYRMDAIPREPPPEFAKLQDAIFGRGDPCQPPAVTTTTTSYATEDLLVSLHAKIEEINESETRQHKELEALFSALAKPYPGLRGLLCGVRHSFRGRDDRCAERKALFSATTEYIEEADTEASS